MDPEPEPLPGPPDALRSQWYAAAAYPGARQPGWGAGVDVMPASCWAPWIHPAAPVVSAPRLRSL